MRADALRNRTTILDTARALIAEVGPEASMEEIATRAGVAVGTLYRHFPGKDELVAAVMAASVDGIAIKINAALRRAQAGASPSQEIATLLEEIVDDTATLFAIKAVTGATTVDQDAERAATDAFAHLLDLARDAGQIADDIGVDDVYLLLSTAPANLPRPARGRWLALVTRGLTTAPRRPQQRAAP